MNFTLKQKNTIGLIIVALIYLAPVLIMIATRDTFLHSVERFPLDFSLYFAVLLGAIIVNYSLKSMKFLAVVMLAAGAGLAVYAFYYLL
ncbi:hypothetical protein BpOF4_18880 [Alkalihalophilus pseudofirmus OF4]|jgi:hypothetical protein|uniref:Uncharacterized protein n=3 Tax=Alkalihalophilus TaxID=2893060 RepID=D3FSV0_ALKPO|nr:MULTISPECIES: hypothetical protein [Alkalihalophilus]ADC51815.1 hypothetical protein BpOF4_18880 [Alkalihalophilus pseudofirmus OF4]ERN53448.1 hypothetical protein A33I_11295 [Alkalihalophilus marmarensis DSM 21297]MCM3490917.1 hypothetical protein [Alkalihalophilus marmarensis]MDV2885070.1 hypothetical protein [Alkalihalophilus pseudofirmus]MED1599748.1 hypothetical protein [Alkalihalophilus marmarensis]